MQRTNEAMTAGICNIPLSLPATLFFNTELDTDALKIYSMLDSFKIDYIKEFTASGNIHIQSTNEVESKILKQVFRNFRGLKPKCISQYKYLFWEIDEQTELIQDVLGLYNYLKLPVYVHKSMRGFHFLSVKPIEKSVWQFAIQNLRHTNPKFPPVTLRIKANKYVGELEQYKEGFCIYPDDKIHRDTEYLKKHIENQDVIALEQNYMIVFYPFPIQKELDDMTLEQREQFQDEQILNSEVNRI